MTSNYRLKSRVLKKEDLLKTLNNLKHHLYFDDTFSSSLHLDYWVYLYTNYSKNEIKEGFRVLNNKYKRTKRLRDRIFSFFDKDCLFLTLTFNNKTLKNTSFETRRQYVRKFLKSYSDKYVANVDFGEKYGREHYHAVIQCDHVDHNTWHFGSINFRKINVNSISAYKLSEYVDKLTHHAIKKTCKRYALIYSKKS